MHTLGNFEHLAANYQAGRRGFEDDVFEAISKHIGGLERKEALDVGCGTGIATQQLARFGTRVTGSDISEGMILSAAEDDRIAYVVAPTDNLPFPNGSFDLVTAFSAFHWFTDHASIQEIVRVLKPGGHFAVINKHDVSGIRKDVAPLFARYKNQQTGVKRDYKPDRILDAVGFESVVTHSFQGVETFTFNEAFVYLQSIALWNIVPDEEKEDMLSAVRSFCHEQLQLHGALTRELETCLTIGKKSEINT